MPELPEVETTRRGVEPYVKGKEIVDVIVRQPRLRWPVPPDLSSDLTGLTIGQIRRRAKYLLLETGQGTLIVHLGMSGCLRIFEDPAPKAQKHDHVDIILTGQRRLRFTDPRRFGAILWTCQPIWEHPLLSKLGPEPLGDEFTAQRLFIRSRGRSQAIKTFIMDNHTVVGVGNIYANEALFVAGIRPDKSCGTVSKKRYEKLVTAIQEVLQRAIEQGGTTLKDFVGSDGKPGYFKQQLAVYGRSGQPCLTCGTVITEIRQGNRSSCFCKRCQR
ncbi:bifunctional DNA-formamidopyrimidine glycosylase/DNA-(apurinic or apyrimidinic site) lyase [Candidatus Sororendozoicomonas aggregata]|uniref:bifunctional DNA-formamidopyrimidine glycosylase/DNA-(apurinic or apyrimidinic site) lyase n=1 Tax=Candidatus Sororendozoicomonas aggregata TaxID=3073239 RepID=UPI002ED094AC